jgi:RHS repeat-associated protein
MNGNETSSVTATATNTYEWDAADRLVAINGGPNRSEFTYDGMGRRVRIVEKVNGVAQTTNLFLWCSTELCEQRDSTGSTVSRRFFGQGEQIAGTNYYFTRDHLGSVREMTDGTGAIRARYEYDPYGRRTKVSGDLDADCAFTGHYYHPVSGIYLTLYRAYDPDSARWLSRDPAGEQAGINLFAYVANDPIQTADIYGLKPYDMFADALSAANHLMQYLYDNPMIVGENKERWEKSATIFKRADGKCYYPWPKTDKDRPWKSPYDLTNDKWDANDTAVAHGHSHVAGEDYSVQDTDNADLFKLPEYILTPTGTIKEYVPGRKPPVKIIGRIKSK